LFVSLPFTRLSWPFCQLLSARIVLYGICLFIEGGSEYGYYAMQQAYIGAVPFLGTVYFDASVVSYLRQQMYVTFVSLFLLIV